MKKIAVINDLSGFGKCSLSAAMPIISAHKIQCCPLPTGIFSNQTGYESYKSVDFTAHMPSFINEWKKLGAEFDGILTGFISNSEQGKIISDFIDDFKKDNTVVLVDPVMGDDGKIYPCYDEKSIDAVKQLVSKADIITPNLTELCLLCGNDYTDIFECGSDIILEQIKSMSAQINKKVIVTGIHLSEDIIANAVFDNGKFTVIKSKKLGGGFSGTGDILASYVLSEYLNKSSVENAVKNASDFIEKAIACTIKDADENYVPADGIHFENMLDII